MTHDQQNTSTNATTDSDAVAIHRRAIAIDMHVDTVQRMLDEHVDLSTQLSDGHFDTVRAKDGGLDAQFFSIWVEPQLFGGGGPAAIKRADDQIAAIHELARAASRDVGFGHVSWRRSTSRCRREDRSIAWS